VSEVEKPGQEHLHNQLIIVSFLAIWRCSFEGVQGVCKGGWTLTNAGAIAFFASSQFGASAAADAVIEKICN